MYLELFMNEIIWDLKFGPKHNNNLVTLQVEVKQERQSPDMYTGYMEFVILNHLMKLYAILLILMLVLILYPHHFCVHLNGLVIKNIF